MYSFLGKQPSFGSYCLVFAKWLFAREFGGLLEKSSLWHLLNKKSWSAYLLLAKIMFSICSRNNLSPNPGVLLSQNSCFTSANLSRIPMLLIWGHQRSKSSVSQEFPRLSYWDHQRSKAKFWQISQDLLSGFTRGQKASYPGSSSWGHQEWKSKTSQELPRSARNH